MELAQLWAIPLANVLGMLLGFTFGLLLRSSAAAIVAYLVYALVLPPLAGARPAWWNLAARVVRVLDLIEVLRERERFGGAAPS